jgi:type VI secretion system protein ImpK
MREEMANLVYPMLSRGMAVKEALERGETLDFELEQAALRALLLTDLEARRWPDFGGDQLVAAGQWMSPSALPSAPPPPGSTAAPEAVPFLGIRYALTCWLDEIFVLDSSWDVHWNEQKLEGLLYGSNDRAWKFWEQAQVAEKRSAHDALEVFFLCVMLGFRGDLARDAAKLDAWVTATRAHIARTQGGVWPYPPEMEPHTAVAPLRGPQRLQRVVLAGGLLLLVLIPLLVLFLLQQLNV